MPARKTSTSKSLDNFLSDSDGKKVTKSPGRPRKTAQSKIEKANSEENYYNSESEGKEYKINDEIFKDFDEKYDDYIQTGSQESYFYSPEANGTWNSEENQFGFH